MIVVVKPSRVRLRVARGEARSWQFRLVDKFSLEGIDLTGLTLAAYVRPDIDSATVFSPTVTPDGDQATNPGVFVVSVSTANTMGLGITEHVIDVWDETANEVIVDPSPFEVYESVRQP